MARRRHGEGRRRVALAGAVAAVLLLGCASPDGPEGGAPGSEPAMAESSGGGGPAGESGVGGTGLGGDEGGVGGTGIQAAGGDGVGGTGIFGTITEVGSVTINGLRVAVDDETRVTVDGAPASARALAPGQVAWVEAVPRAHGRLRAREVAVFHAVVGPLERIDEKDQWIEALGQRIRVLPDARLLPAGASGEESRLEAFEPGTWVRVSALPPLDGGPLEATRIEALSAPEDARVLGAAPPEPAGVLHVGGLQVELAPDVRLEEGPPGRPLALAGRWRPEAHVLVAEAVREVVYVAPGLERLSLEGYLQDRPAARQLRLHGLVIDVSAVSDRLEPVRPAQRVWVRARITAGHELRAERLAVRPPRQDLPPSGAGRATPRPSVGDRGRDAPPSSPERIERPERVERIEAPPRPEPVDRPAPVVRPEAPTRIDRIQAPTDLERPLRLRTRQR